MPLLDEIVWDGISLFADLETFRDFLKTNPQAERDQLLPFFAARPQLCALVGTLHDRVKTVTHWKCELDLFGDFKCDLAVGSPKDGAFVLVEFEDARRASLFDARGRVKNSRWGRQAERAVSQVNDWLFRLGTEGSSARMERDFGNRSCAFMGVIVVGRSQHVSSYDKARLNWRSQNTVIGGSKLSMFTYDDLLEWLDGRARFLSNFVRS